MVDVKFFFPSDAVQLGVASTRVERTAQVLEEKEKQNEDDPTKQPEAGDQVHANEDKDADPRMPSQHPENENNGDGLGRAGS